MAEAGSGLPAGGSFQKPPVLAEEEGLGGPRWAVLP